MRRAIPLTLIAVALAGAAYWGARRCCFTPAPIHCHCTGWLQEEFKVDEATCERIRISQTAFAEVCETHCAAVREARAAVVALPGDVAAEVRAGAVAEVSAAEAHCMAAREAQARRISAMLPAGDRERYLQLVLPRLRALDHEAGSGSPVRK